MIDVFFNGGPIFMGILSLVLLLVLLISVGMAISLIFNKVTTTRDTLVKINYIRSLGLFAMIFGLLGQLIGLFSAFRAIKLGEVEVTHSLFSEGFRISMISSLYGFLIFVLSLLIWFVLKRTLKNSV